MIDLSTIITLGSVAGAIVAMLTLTARMKKSVEGIVHAELYSVRRWLENQQRDLDDAKDELHRLYKGEKIILRHLVSEGANGEVRQALDTLDQMAEDRAHRGVSYQAEGAKV
ncbi:MAG: hypothetical protein LBC26_06620 [Oscillospiraceae bacterium]|jgi:hypothetical protein|nr:hypothetical protein [Oscillospiraceae bacterium]